MMWTGKRISIKKYSNVRAGLSPKSTPLKLAMALDGTQLVVTFWLR